MFGSTRTTATDTKTENKPAPGKTANGSSRAISLATRNASTGERRVSREARYRVRLSRGFSEVRNKAPTKRTTTPATGRVSNPRRHFGLCQPLESVRQTRSQ